VLGTLAARPHHPPGTAIMALYPSQQQGQQKAGQHSQK
jgi:hypothetical protein